MYDLKLNKNEKIVIISDNTQILNQNHEYTTIITNERLLILDYPSNYHNSKEELRILNKMNYIKTKEIILEIKLSQINDIKTKDDNATITFKDGQYITIKDNEILSNLKKYVNQ